MSRFLYRPIEEMEPYTPGEQPKDGEYIKLNTNESPYPPSPGVIDCLKSEDIKQLRLYPDPTCLRLRESLGHENGVPYSRICVTNGSDEALAFAFMAYGRSGAAFADITYGFYSVFAELYGCPAKIIPLRKDFTMDTDALAKTAETLFIANPNAPTGIALPRDEIEHIVKSRPNRVVVVDEAYVDFGGESAAPLCAKYDNLLVTRTYSKSRSMAGARIGYTIAGEAISSDMDKLRYTTNPYNMDSLALALGLAASREADYYKSRCRKIAETRDSTAEKLRGAGLEVLPSRANFIFVRAPGKDGGELYKNLRAKQILVRHFVLPRIKDYIRVTIGTPEQMDKLYDALSDILNI